MMGRCFRVFVSSTFSDLRAERKASQRAILELGHMPAGMELFPAAPDSPWKTMMEEIKASDYFVLIIGGRYGALDETGLSYTEKEYEYALSLDKPVIPLLHRDPNQLPRDHTETDQRAWRKLQEFRTRVKRRHVCVFWDSADDLKSKLIAGLTAAIRKHPAPGWTRTDDVLDG